MSDTLGPRVPPTNGGAQPGGLYDLWQQKLDAKKQRAGPRQVVLPSGLPVVAKRPHLMFLLQQGRIPDALTPMVSDYIDKISGDQDTARSVLMAEVEKDPDGFLRRWIELCDAIWLEAVVDPPFAKPDEHGTLPDGHLNLNDVDVPDKEYLFIWCQGVDQTVQEFLDGKAREVAALGAVGGRQGPRAAPGDPPGDRPDPGVVAGVPDLPGRPDLGAPVRLVEARDNVGDGGEAAQQEQRPGAAVHGQRAAEDVGDGGRDTDVPHA